MSTPATRGSAGSDLTARDLPALPSQPEGLAWPTSKWSTVDFAAGSTADDVDHGRLQALLDILVDDEAHPAMGQTFAAAVVWRGSLAAERYGLRPVRDLRALEPDPPLERVTADAELLSWSMAKSLTHLAVGVAVADGLIQLDQPVPEPAWSAPDDPRRSITWEDLLTMRPGLAWYEDYNLGDGALPDVVEMLFGSGAADVAAFAARFPAVNPPGSIEAYTYSSGTTNIVAANLQRVLAMSGDADSFDRWMHGRLLDPIGMVGARLEFDSANTFMGSSYAHATLREWCRFGLLAMRGGEWDGNQIVPTGWIDHGRRPRSIDEDMYHGAHWWSWDHEQMPFGAHGFEGQRIICFPTRDVIVLRFGKISERAEARHVLNNHLSEIAACFPSL